MGSAPREQWSTSTGFVLAAIGSAVGLGNMWRFSYLTAENGGAAFVLLYLAITLVVGLPILLAEFAIGRSAQVGPIRALALHGGATWRSLGFLFIASGFLIASYYGVIAGWTLRYALGGLATGFAADPGAHFGDVASGWDAFAFHCVFMLISVGVVAGGVRRGIERTSLVLMPTLFVLVIALAVYASTLEGAGDGYAYYLRTDFSKIFDLGVLKDATGQAFFSLSLGMGAMLTYGSYLRRDGDLPNESLVIAGSDIGIAFLAGLVVFPLLFALGLASDVTGSTVGTLFITMPQAFAEMGAAGRVVGFVFFLALAVAALTSAISLVEVVVAAASDGLGWSRARGAAVMGVGLVLVGLPSALHTPFLEAMDALAGNVFLLAGGLALAIFVGWVMKDPMKEVAIGAEGIRWFGLWRFFLRFAVPAFLVFVLYQAVPDAFETVRKAFPWGG